MFVLELGGNDKRLPLDREETDMTHSKMEVYKGASGNFVLEWGV